MNLKSLTQPELAEKLKQLGQPAFRAGQVFSWLHKGVRSYEEMTNLPKSLREALAREFPLYIPKVVRKQESKKDGTINGGMIPKVDACTDAIKDGVKKVFIINGEVPHALLIELLTNEGLGTMFVE